MKFTQGLAAVVLMATAAAAHAEFSATITGVTDYNFRGISLSANDPALQGSLDWGFDNGIYVGAWASNRWFSQAHCRREASTPGLPLKPSRISWVLLMPMYQLPRRGSFSLKSAFSAPAGTLRTRLSTLGQSPTRTRPHARRGPLRARTVRRRRHRRRSGSRDALRAPPRAGGCGGRRTPPRPQM